MSTSLSSLVDNIFEGFYNNKYIDCKSSLRHKLTKNNLILSICLKCKKYYSKDLIKRFANRYEFCNGETNKFILFLRIGVYPYQYMDSWIRFDESFLPDKEAFYISLNMEDIIDVDYRRATSLFLIIKI